MQIDKQNPGYTIGDFPMPVLSSCYWNGNAVVCPDQPASRRGKAAGMKKPTRWRIQ